MRTYYAPQLRTAVLVVLLVAPRASSGAPDAAKAVNPGQVEVRFANGSIVVMTLLQDKIEIVTEYGKLVVPPRDIRTIEFGIHASAEEQRKIEDALRLLPSKVFREREKAVDDLVTLGPLAYLRLQSAAKAQDPEAAQRAQATIKKIQEKFHARLLRPREEDVVRTAKFTIVGRITTPTLRATAEEFGELELRPARLLAIHQLGAEAKKELRIDAATYGSPGGRKWLDTGVRVDTHMGLKVTATGQVDLWPQGPGAYMAGPDGQTGRGAVAGFNGQALRFGPGVGQSGGELLGRIGEEGVPFVLGSRYTQTPKDAGQLYLQIVPSPWGGPSAGEYRVTITSGAFADSGKQD